MQGSSRWFLAGLGRRLFPISQSVVIEDRSTHDPGRDPGLIGAHHPRLSMWAAGCGNYPKFHTISLSIWAHTRKCEMMRMSEGLKALVTLEESSRLSLTLSGRRWGRYQVRTCLPDLQALEHCSGRHTPASRFLANGKEPLSTTSSPALHHQVHTPFQSQQGQHNAPRQIRRHDTMYGVRGLISSTDHRGPRHGILRQVQLAAPGHLAGQGTRLQCCMQCVPKTQNV